MTANASRLRFLALGDSYTVGEGVPPSACWPVQLVAMLRRQAYAIDEPVIIAQTGWTSDELLAGMAALGWLGTYDLVSLLIGVNDQYRGQSQAVYQAQFVKLLASAVALGRDDPSRVMVLSIPDWGITPFAAGRNPAQISVEIDCFNVINREASKQAGVHYIDVAALSRQAAHDPSLLAGDGLHPSRSMYTCWATAVLPIARQALGRAR